MQFNTLFAHTGFAVNLTSVFLSVAQFMSGVMSISMPKFLQGVNYLSPIRYAIRNLAPYSIRDLHFTCNSEQMLPDGTCSITNGLQVLELYDLNTNPGINLLCLGMCALVYRILAYLLLKASRTRWEGKKKQQK